MDGINKLNNTDSRRINHNYSKGGLKNKISIEKTGKTAIINKKSDLDHLLNPDTTISWGIQDENLVSPDLNFRINNIEARDLLKLVDNAVEELSELKSTNTNQEFNDKSLIKEKEKILIKLLNELGLDIETYPQNTINFPEIVSKKLDIDKIFLSSPNKNEAKDTIIQDNNSTSLIDHKTSELLNATQNTNYSYASTLFLTEKIKTLAPKAYDKVMGYKKTADFWMLDLGKKWNMYSSDEVNIAKQLYVNRFIDLNKLIKSSMNYMIDSSIYLGKKSLLTGLKIGDLASNFLTTKIDSSNTNKKYLQNLSSLSGKIGSFFRTKLNNLKNREDYKNLNWDNVHKSHWDGLKTQFKCFSGTNKKYYKYLWNIIA